MTATELYEIAKASVLRQKRDLPESLVQDMKKAAQQGSFCCYYYDDLSKLQKESLGELGFVIESFNDRNDIVWKVKWDHIEWV